MISNVDICKTLTAPQVFTIIQAFSDNCFIPEKSDYNNNVWSDCVAPALYGNKNLTKISPNSNTWLPFTLQLVILNHFDQELISRVLSRSYLQNYLKRDNMTTLKLNKILILYQTVAMKSHIDLSSIDVKTISDVFKRYKDECYHCDIQKDLIQKLGKDYVLTNVRTKYMHLIPTLVKINKQTKLFQPFNNEISRDEDGFISLDDVSCTENESL